MLSGMKINKGEATYRVLMLLAIFLPPGFPELAMMGVGTICFFVIATHVNQTFLLHETVTPEHALLF